MSKQDIYYDNHSINQMKKKKKEDKNFHHQVFIMNIQWIKQSQT
jgi:hypothetical protein